MGVEIVFTPWSFYEKIQAQLFIIIGLVAAY